MFWARIIFHVTLKLVAVLTVRIFYGTGHDTLQFSCLMAQTNKEVFILTPKLKNEIGYSPLLQSGRVALRNNKN